MACFAAPDGDKEAVAAAAATADDNQNSGLAHSPSLYIYLEGDDL